MPNGRPGTADGKLLVKTLKIFSITICNDNAGDVANAPPDNPMWT